MRVAFAQIALTCAWAPIALAFPTEDAGLYNFLSRRALSPDNTCGNLYNGNNNGYTCNPNAATGGACCSQYGYCGSTSDYCGAGCQSTFGTCGGSESLPIDPNQCGPSNGNNKCLSGLCCSQNGWCGNTTDYCTAGCQSGFGDCTTTTPGGNGGGDGTCGPQFGNKQCPSGQCCSAAVRVAVCMTPPLLTDHRVIVGLQQNIAQTQIVSSPSAPATRAIPLLDLQL